MCNCLFSCFGMTRIVFFIVFLGLFGFGMSQNHAFATNSPYSVKGVEVDVLDESSFKARNKAFLEAQRKAFQVLASRYYSAEELKVMAVPPDALLSSLIQDFKITSEQASTKRYKGVFDFRFKTYEVNNHFGRGPINFSDNTPSQVDKVLLVPFYHEEKKAVVFNKDQNPFWGSLLNETKNFPNILLPEGNIQDMTDIGTKNNTFMTPVTIRKLKARYDVTSILIAVAHVNLKDQQSINIELFDAGIETQKPVLSFEEAPELIGNSTLLRVTELTKPKSAIPIIIEEEVAAPQEGEVLESVINPTLFDPSRGKGARSDAGRDRMIQMAQDRSREARRQRQAEPPPQQRGSEIAEQEYEEGQSVAGEIQVSIFFNTMSEWVTTQKEISRLNGLKGIRIVTLKTNQAETVVEYSDWNKLLQSMKASGYKLEPLASNMYLLKRLSDNF
jgi:hypothetical protein